MAAFKTIMGAAFALSLLVVNAAVASPLKTIMSITGSTDGIGPRYRVTEANGLLYGSTNYGGEHGFGALFRIDPVTGDEARLYSFKGAADGYVAGAALTKAGDVLYGVTAAGGASASGTVFRFNPTKDHLQEVDAFTGGNDGSDPSTAMLYADDMLYGTTGAGGSAGFGTVFRLDPRSGQETVLFAFQGGIDGAYPFSLIEQDGFLYGTTDAGGPTGTGIVFKIDRTTGAETIFDTSHPEIDGDFPSGLVGLAGKLYVTMRAGGAAACGTILEIDPATGSSRLVHSFTCSRHDEPPIGGMTALGDKLYGTTGAGGAENYGSVIKLDRVTGAVSIIHSFAAYPDDGYEAYSGLTRVGDVLFGVTPIGGTYDGGTVFRIDPEAKTETILHSFVGKPGTSAGEGLVADKGKLLFTSGQGGPFNRGEVVKIDPATGTGTIVDGFALPRDASNPVAPLIKVDGAFFGTTLDGGAYDTGTVFKLNGVTGAQTIVHSFAPYSGSAGHSDGSFPFSGLTRAGKLLYGTTVDGGLHRLGTIYSVDPSTGFVATVHSFADGVDGSVPEGGLINVAGQLYGTTFGYTATNHNGTIFRFDPVSNTLTTVHVFAGGSDGQWPSTSLLAVGGILYGSTLYGGTTNEGTIFDFDPATGVETVLHSFDGYDGYAPQNPLLAVGGQLYGNTYTGGAYDHGVVFRMDRFTGTEHILHNFKNAADGGLPASNLIFLNGLLYGGTSTGGAAGLGTVFSLEP